MDWKRLLAYITGSVDQELLLRNEYLAAENVILFPSVESSGPPEGSIVCREGLGGLLKYYYREAA